MFDINEKNLRAVIALQQAAHSARDVVHFLDEATLELPTLAVQYEMAATLRAQLLMAQRAYERMLNAARNGVSA